jgi:hypothetical protein
MKAKVELEIEKEDLAYELNELVKQLSESEIRKMIKEQAREMVKVEVEKIVGPLVEKYLKEEKFEHGNNSWNANSSIEDRVKNSVIGYLNEPVYLYSKDNKEPSKRYVRSSSNDKSRITRIVEDQIMFYVDETFTEKVKEIVSSLNSEKSKAEEIMRDQIKKTVLENIK